MRTALLVALVASLFCSGCKSACRQLSEKLCDCIITTIDRDACLTAAANQEGQYPPNEQQNEVCRDLLPGCDCHTVNTPQGMVACGLAVGI
jgi:hypothetical protein